MIEWINIIIRGFAAAIGELIGLLPNSPFTWSMGDLQGIWCYAAYFIPFQAMVVLLETYVVGVAIWYVVRWALRFVKYIG